MAKSQIRIIKERRFWLWMCREVYGHTGFRHPVKRRVRKKPDGRYWERLERRIPSAVENIKKMIQEWKVKNER